MTKWQEVESRLLRHILAHSLPEGGKLPSDREIAHQFGCSVQPVHRAMESLARKGLVLRRAGAATTVLSQPPLIDDHEFSFSYSSTYTYGHTLTTKLIEKACRLPLPGNTWAIETKAQKALGLRRKEPFYAISRLRTLNEIPRVIHRSYLNPAYFSATFLVEHNFEQESLITLFNANGFRIEARKTTLRARFPTPQEVAILKCEGEPVLEAEQEVEALHVATGAVVTIEYLQACYVKWEYQIANRRAPMKEDDHE